MPLINQCTMQHCSPLPHRETHISIYIYTSHLLCATRDGTLCTIIIIFIFSLHSFTHMFPSLICVTIWYIPLQKGNKQESWTISSSFDSLIPLLVTQSHTHTHIKMFSLFAFCSIIFDGCKKKTSFSELSERIETIHLCTFCELFLCCLLFF